MIKAINDARTGIDAGFNRLEEASRRIARQEAVNEQAGKVVDIMQAKRGGRASLAALRTADAMIGSLLDVLA